MFTFASATMKTNFIISDINTYYFKLLTEYCFAQKLGSNFEGGLL